MGQRFSSSSVGNPSLYEGLGSPVSLQNLLNKQLYIETLISYHVIHLPIFLYQTREDPPSYSSSVMKRYDSFENPLAGSGGQSFGSHEDERTSSGNRQFGSALYDFTAGGDDEVRITDMRIQLSLSSCLGASLFLLFYNFSVSLQPHIL